MKNKKCIKLTQDVETLNVQPMFIMENNNGFASKCIQMLLN